jgi:hypothetical protein
MLILAQETTNGDTLPNNQLSPTQSVLGVSLIAAIATAVVLFIGIAVAGRTLTQGRPWLDYGNFFVVAFGLVVIVIGYLALLMFLNQFASGTQVLGFFTALTGATVGLVGTYFGVKTSSDTVEVLGRNGIAQPLTVTSVTPPENASTVDANTTVTAQFSRAVNDASITQNTFQLVSLPNRVAVPGDRGLDAQNTRVSFTQTNPPLAAGTTYQATVTTDVRDQSGNQLVSEKTWTFTVA